MFHMKPRASYFGILATGNLPAIRFRSQERSTVGTQEWLLTFGVIVVPLAIAVIVTLWTLEQARYRPKRKRPPGIRRDDAPAEPQAAANATPTPPPAEPGEPAT